MTKSIKTLSLILLLNVMYAHGMKHKLSDQECLHGSTSTTVDDINDSRLLLELPDDVLGIIVRYTNPDKYVAKSIKRIDLFNNVKLLIRLSLVCKKFERLRVPDTIKTMLNLDQKTLDNNFTDYAFFKNAFPETDNDITPFLKLLITMNAKTNTLCRSLSSCVQHTTNAYVVEHFIMHHDADINQQDKEDQTPLRWAINLNKPNIVRVLLAHDANMYLADNQGKTPTDMALLYDRIECVKALVEHGVDTTIKYYRSEDYEPSIAEWATSNAWWHKENTGHYREIYRSVTGEEMPKPSEEKSASELLYDTCVIS